METTNKKELKRYTRDEVWAIYVKENGQNRIVAHFTGVKPDRCKAWKNLEKEISKYEGIGYCRNENFHNAF